MRIVCWQTILMQYHTLFLSRIGKISQNLSSAAVVVGTLRVRYHFNSNEDVIRHFHVSLHHLNKEANTC